MYVVAVVLPPVQAEFGVDRANASLPYTLMMICLGVGGMWTGKLADRFRNHPCSVGRFSCCHGWICYCWPSPEYLGVWLSAWNIVGPAG